MPYSSGTFSRVHDFTSDRDAGIKIQASRTDAEFDGIATALSTAILKDGTQTTTAVVPFAFGISIVDNKAITLGTNSDITIQYDETTNDSLEIAAAVEGAALGIVLKSDQGDDNADQHKLSIADGGTLTLASKISGSFVTYLTHTPNSTVASSTLAVAGNLTVGGSLTLGSGAVISEAELEQLDGITAGTVTASKAVVVDSDKDIASFRNITLTGELDAGSLDISGDADIDGTLEADAMTLNGTAITTTATLSTGISNGNVLVANASVVDNDFLRVDGTSIEGRSASEVLSDISAAPAAGDSNIVTTGALDSGSITSGFGAIDNGTSGIRTNTFTAETSVVPSANDGATLGTASLGFADLFLADGGIIKFGNDQDVTLTHVADTGLTLNDNLTITTGDNDPQLTLTSTDTDASNGPRINMHRDSSSPADDDVIGLISFQGENDASEVLDLAFIFAQNADVTDGTEDGRMIFQTFTNGSALERINIQPTETVFNEGSEDLDFRVEGNGDANALFVEGETDKVGIGTNDPDDKLHVYEPSGQRVARFEANNSTSAFIAFKASNTSFPPAIGVKDEALFFSIGDAVEKARIDSSGNFIVNSDDSTDTTTYDNTTGSHGPILHAETRLDIARSATQMTLNSTTSSSSTYIIFFRAGGEIGSITHNSASTVSYNAFTGSHWGRLSDNSKPTILKGTVLETIDEMCDWYEVEFTIPEVKYVDGDAIPKDKKVGDVKTKAQGKRYLVPLEDIGDKKVGDSFTFTYKDGVEYTGTLKLEDEEKHSKCKVSDVADSKRVYGVFFSWDSEDDGYNDMYVAGLGTYVVRVHKDVIVESGDLLVSNGDGTAKLQDDDIIRTKTIGKVLTNIKQETYSDGSYTVPCALYCG
jgi:hypothetical protein